MPTETSNVRLWQALQIVIGLLVTVAISITGYAINKIDGLSQAIIGMDRRLSTMEGNRFTSGDGLQVWKEISDIRTQIAGLPKEYPPMWFKERVDKLEKQVDSNAAILQRIAINVDAK